MKCSGNDISSWQQRVHILAQDVRNIKEARLFLSALPVHISRSNQMLTSNAKFLVEGIRQLCDGRRRKSLVTRIVGLVAVILGSLTGRFARGEIISYTDFSDISALTLNGTATQLGTGTEARIRVIGGGCLSGSFFTDLPVEISRFSTHFVFQITGAGGLQDPTGSAGGDGFTFAIQPVGPTALGNLGGWLGFEGIGSGVAVEFDTHKGPDETFDPS